MATAENTATSKPQAKTVVKKAAIRPAVKKKAAKPAVKKAAARKAAVKKLPSRCISILPQKPFVAPSQMGSLRPGQMNGF